MHKIWHGCRLSYDEFVQSKDKVFCVLQKGFNTSKLVYYTKEDETLKSLINDDTYNLEDCKVLQIYEVSNENKISYIEHNVPIENIKELNNTELDDLFIKTYKEFE